MMSHEVHKPDAKLMMRLLLPFHTSRRYFGHTRKMARRWQSEHVAWNDLLNAFSINNIFGNHWCLPRIANPYRYESPIAVDDGLVTDFILGVGLTAGASCVRRSSYPDRLLMSV